MNAQNKKEGFTIIEVVLVLAIAGLIFLMIFIALPALQRNQRDTARKSNISKVLAAVTSYRSNNDNANPSINAAFAKYLDGTYTAGPPAKIAVGSSGYNVITAANPTTTAAVPSGASNDDMVLQFNSTCSTDGKTVKGTSKQVTVAMTLENGDAGYCQDS